MKCRGAPPPGPGRFGILDTLYTTDFIEIFQSVFWPLRLSEFR